MLFQRFLCAREVSCHRTLRWTPSSLVSLATGGRCVANNLSICIYIALALDIHVFCLHAEAEDAILHSTNKEGMLSRPIQLQVGNQF